MSLHDLLTRHRNLYETEPEETLWKTPAQIPEFSTLSTSQSGKVELFSGDSTASPGITTMTGLPERKPLAVDEVDYPGLAAPPPPPPEDSLSQFTRVLRWNQRLYTQPMDEEV